MPNPGEVADRCRHRAESTESVATLPFSTRRVASLAILGFSDATGNRTVVQVEFAALIFELVSASPIFP